MRARRDPERGSALIEFSFLAPALLLLMVGVAYTGANMDRYLGLEQLARAAAHLHAQGVDFSLPEKRALLNEAAAGLDLSEEGGDTIVYLSTVAETADGPRIVRRFAVGATAVGDAETGPAEQQYDGLVDPPAPATLDFDLPRGSRVYIAEAVHEPRGLTPPVGAGKDLRLRARAVY